MNKCIVGEVHVCIYSLASDCRAVLWTDKHEKWGYMNLVVINRSTERFLVGNFIFRSLLVFLLLMGLSTDELRGQDLKFHW